MVHVPTAVPAGIHAPAKASRQRSPARTRRTPAATAAVAALAIVALPVAMPGVVPGAHASGFALIENSAASLGTAYAGVAASAEDASTIYFNPAGMTFLPHRQMSVAGHLIRPSMKFSDGGSQAPAGRPFGGTGGEAGGLALVPNTFATWALTDDLRLGIGVNVPFGLKTEYGDGWIGRYQALRSEVRTININPSVALRLSDTVSIGAGVSIQRANATLTNATQGGAGDNRATIKASDTSFGFNAGVILQLTPDTRIGASYRSAVGHHLEGAIAITNAQDVRLSAGPIASDLKLPASFSLSSFTRLNDRWDVMLDASWTGWSSFERLVIVRTDTLGVVTDQPENWRDTWRFSAGANYRWHPGLMLRFGVAYDQAPVGDAWRTARVPDGSRTWLAVGARYTMNRKMTVDAGFAHIIVRDPAISDLRGTGAGQAGNLVGRYSNNINIVSGQVNYQF